MKLQSKTKKVLLTAGVVAAMAVSGTTLKVCGDGPMKDPNPPKTDGACPDGSNYPCKDPTPEAPTTPQ